MTETEEQTIIRSIVDGNRLAFGVLVDHYKNMAVVLAYNILLNQEDAEEAAQDAFVRACRFLPTYSGKSRFATWLYRIVVNTALNRKKNRRHRFIDIAQIDNRENDIVVADGTQRTKEQRKHILRALMMLNDNERVCLTLYYLHELSVEEIRELTGKSVSAIKVLLHRGRKNLYAALDKNLKGEIKHLIYPT